MAEITREFSGGKMIVKRDGNVVREVTPEQLQQRIDSIDKRIEKMNERKATVADWKAQAEASA